MTSAALTTGSPPESATTLANATASSSSAVASSEESTSTTAATASSTATTKAIDCAAGSSEWQKKWSEDEQDYCCEKLGLGCRTTTKTHGKDSGHGRTAPASLDSVNLNDPYACQEGSEEKWSSEESSWCCQHKHLGCSKTKSAAKISLKLRYDCEDGYSTRTIGWSVEKQDWCCEHQLRGCKKTPSTTMETHDCDDGYLNWKVRWSERKRSWCCKAKNRGCSRDLLLDGDSSRDEAVPAAALDEKFAQPQSRLHGGLAGASSSVSFAAFAALALLSAGAVVGRLIWRSSAFRLGRYEDLSVPARESVVPARGIQRLLQE